MLARVPRGYQAIWLGMILFSFGCCILGLTGYIARFGNYQLEGFMLIIPLDQPSWTWRLLSHFSLDVFVRFRLWGMVWFVISVVGFAFSYTVKKWRPGDYVTAGFFLAVAGLLLWAYDPVRLFGLFKEGAVLLGTPARERWENSLRLMDTAALWTVIFLLSYSLFRIFRLMATTSILQKRAQALGVAIGCGILSIFSVVLFGLGPASIFNAFSLATTLLPVVDYPIFDTTYLQALPFAGLAALGAVMLSIIKYGFLGAWRIGPLDLDRQITMANRAVRLALHTFKNRFFAIQTAINMVAPELPPPDDEKTERIHQQIQWIREICTETLTHLDILYVQSGRLQVKTAVLSWNELWVEARHRCAGRLTGITIQESAGEPVHVWGDREHLVSVLENLVQNAIDAVKQKTHENASPRIDIETGREYEWGYIRITDNGPGISRENLRKIFRPFFSTKSSKTNWGMGLAYCHRVIKAHQGFLNLFTTPGEGTTVEVVLRCREKIDAPTNYWQKLLLLLKKNPSGKKATPIG